MPPKTTKPPLTQHDVQQTTMALLRIATVWARRSFEPDTPRDRRADEKLLRSIVELVRRHEDVPLVSATGATKIVVRQSSLAELELFHHVLQAIQAAKADDDRPALAARLRLAFRRAGRSLSSKAAKGYAENLSMERPPTELAGRVLQMHGLRGYGSVRRVERSLARAREIAGRREASRLELIEYFLACLQVPEENLHGIAAAVDAVAAGGWLTAVPRAWHRRSRLGPTLPPPWRRRPYVRYAKPRVGDPVRAVLDSVDDVFEDEPDL